MVTWGRLQRMTWGFWDRYCEEAYCALSTDFVEHGRAPNGFDLEALQAELALVTGRMVGVAAAAILVVDDDAPIRRMLDRTLSAVRVRRRRRPRTAARRSPPSSGPSRT